MRELVVRDVNHPSVIFWDNGNEGGFNYDLVDDYHLYDPQKRPVIHPWQNEAGKINTTHYRAYDCCAGKYLDGPELVMPTEVLHGLYDGGHGAGLADLWSRMLQNPLAVGAFLWVLADEGIVRTDRDGALDTDGNHAPGRHRGPVPREGGELLHDQGRVVAGLPRARPPRPPAAHVRRAAPRREPLRLHDLAQVSFEWRLRALRRARTCRGRATPTSHGARRPRRTVAPGDRGTLALALPADWRDADALSLTAHDPQGRDIHTWTWMTQGPREIRQRVVSSGGRATGQESGRPGRAGSERHARRDRPRHGPARLGRARRPARLARQRAAHRRGQARSSPHSPTVPTATATSSRRPTRAT